MTPETLRGGLERVLAIAAAAKVLTDRGIRWDWHELHGAIGLATGLGIFPKTIDAEQLTVSRSAELVCSGPAAYSVNVSAEFLKTTSDPSEVLFDLLKKGEMYIALSELARGKGQSDLTINAGQSIALRDPVADGGHPIYALFSKG